MAAHAAPHNFYNHWKHRNNDDTINDQAKVLARPFQIAQKIPGRDKPAHPQHTPRDVEQKERGRVHEGNARHKGGKSAHNGHKAGQHNGLAAVALVKMMGLEQVFLLDEAAVTGKNGRAHMAADAIIDGIAKNALRQSLMLSLDGSPCKLHWLRAYYITGDEAHGSSIFAKLAQAELDGKKTFPFTSGKNLYDFIDVDELANMIVAASVQEEINGIINVCTGEPRSLADRVEQFLRDKNYKIKLDYGAFPDRPYDSPGTWGDATKIKQILAKDQL